MTTREELNQQLAALYHDIGEARRNQDWAMRDLLERIVPQFEIEVGPLCRCEFCLKVSA